MRDRGKRASFTVEASLIMPLICLLTAVFVQTVLYLHDMSIFVSAAYEAAQKGASLQYISSGEREERTREMAVSMLKDKRLACSLEGVRARVQGGRVRVTIKGSTGFFGGISLTAEKEALLLNPVKRLRNHERAAGLWKKEDAK